MDMAAGIDFRREAAPATDSDAVATLKALLDGEMAATKALIADRLGSHVTKIPDLAGHLIRSGGKRLRPLVTLASARMFDYPGEAHVKLGAAVEFIHTATLLHDDVVDRSDRRRGAFTANVIWGNQSSVLVGDFLFSRAFELMVEAGDLRVLEILSRASSVIVEGELMQLETQNNPDTTLDDYLRVIDAKTAELFAAAAEAGAVIAGCGPRDCAAMRAFGRELGLAFQLVDDVLDYTGKNDALGKNTGDDFREGKMTMPLVIALSESGGDWTAFWDRVFSGEQEPADFIRAMNFMREIGAFDATLDRARALADEAKARLAPLPDNAFRQALSDLADFAVSRGY